jgi:CheY-like chemotaxis protein
VSREIQSADLRDLGGATRGELRTDQIGSAPEQATARSQTSSRSRFGVPSEPGRIGRPRVVIVDDQPTFRQAARSLLEARGYDVVGEASSGASAMEAVERHAAQAVLLDVRLGDDDGFGVCGELTRAHSELAVLLASDTDYEHRRDLIDRCGARGFVRKSHLPHTDLEQFWPRD